MRRQRGPQEHGQRIRPGRLSPFGPPVGHRVRSPQRAQHEKTAVRKIDDPGHAEDQRQTRSHQKQGGGVAQPVEQLQRQCFKSQLSTLSREKDQSTHWVKSCADTRVVWKVLTSADSSA